MSFLQKAPICSKSTIDSTFRYKIMYCVYKLALKSVILDLNKNLTFFKGHIYKIKPAPVGDELTKKYMYPYNNTLFYQPIAPAILNIGRYMETTRPPITTPRNTIIIGSIAAVRPSTAESTSSS